MDFLARNLQTLNTETLIATSKDVHLEVNAEKTKCILLSYYQNAQQNHDIKQLTDALEM
jgi:hypothetical protein